MKGFLLKHEKATRVFHWVNAVIFLMLLCSGLAVFNKNLQFLAIPFGGLRNAALVHKYLGIAYLSVPLAYIIVYFDLFKKFVITISKFDEDDKKWLKVAGGYLKPFIKGEVPLQGKYNAGQKMLGWMVIIFSGTLAATGVIMAFYPSFPPTIVRWAFLIHAFYGIFLGCGIFVHFYLAAVNPSSRSELKTMMGNGLIEEEYAKAHNTKWYKEVGAGTDEADTRWRSLPGYGGGRS